MSPELTLKPLLGKTLAKVESPHTQQIEFTTTEGKRYALCHVQDCCESVEIESIRGELDSIIGTSILSALEENSNEDPPGYKRQYPPESCTWTTYTITTAKGQVVIRWLGESNGYYGETPCLVEI